MNKPKAKDYYTDHGMHTAMSLYAQSFDKPDLIATIQYADGSIQIETFEHATAPIKYRTQDREIYEESKHTSKFKEPWFSDKDLTMKELKQGLHNWLVAQNSGKFTITWSKGE